MEAIKKWEGFLEKLIYFVAVSGMIVIRCIGFGSIPGGFNQDGAMGAVDALALATYGTDRFGTYLPAHFRAWGYGQMSVLLSYLTVPFIKIWGLSPLTARLPMLLVSLLGAAAVYGFVRDMISSRAALATLLFLAINPWHFMQSRWALDCNMFPHMFILGLYFLNRGLKKPRSLYLSMLFFALCMYSYGVAFYMVPVFLLAAGIFLLVQKKLTMKRFLLCAGIYFGVSFPIYGTMLINFMKWDTVRLPFVTMPYFEESVRKNDMLFFSQHPGEQFLANLNSLLSVAFLQKPDLIWNAMDDFGTMYRCSLPLIAAGVVITIYKVVKGGDDRFKTPGMLLLIYWGCSIFAGICINHVNVNRINIIFYSHILFAGIAVYHIVRKWRLLAAALLVIYSLQSVLFVNRYFTVWAKEMEDIFYSDFLEAVEFAGEQECDYYYITPDTQYEGSANVSEILTMFAQQIDAEYYQGKTSRFRGAEIAYADRYRFRNPSPEEIRTQEKTAYVVKTEDLLRYDPEQFAVRQFDSYSVVMPRRYAGWQ